MNQQASIESEVLNEAKSPRNVNHLVSLKCPQTNRGNSSDLFRLEFKRLLGSAVDFRAPFLEDCSSSNRNGPPGWGMREIRPYDWFFSTFLRVSGTFRDAQLAVYAAEMRCFSRTVLQRKILDY